MTVYIRPVEPDEIPLLGPIEKSAGELFRDQGMDDVADGGQMPATFILSFTRFGGALVADVDGAVAGFALVAAYDKHAHLYEVSVGREFQGQGIGRKLVLSACDWAVSHEYAALTLSTFSDVPWNAPFYATLGFGVLPESEWSPAFHVLRGREEDAGLDISRRVFMRKELA
ncbi:GNAT family N-acetyltransferase [Parvibaculaceae bacterium PLY_AMNH_Bact1]|nr:GNAT family N-acetyltransferase [Parvibaculaceae bacterium PLY_AMNH_Bact1]